MLLFILPNLWTSPDLPIHAGIVLIVGLGLLGGGVIVDVAETKLNSADDPRECPFLCVRGLGLQVVCESVGVSHG